MGLLQLPPSFAMYFNPSNNIFNQAIFNKSSAVTEAWKYKMLNKLLSILSTLIGH